jgi:hypothetical protein
VTQCPTTVIRLCQSNTAILEKSQAAQHTLIAAEKNRTDENRVAFLDFSIKEIAIPLNME